MGKTKNIQSVERALSILELFQSEKKELSVKDISSFLLLSKSTAFGLINTLANLGYLQQNEETLKYSLGMKLMALGSAVQQENAIVRAGHTILQKVSDAFQETCLCAVEDNHFVVYIDKTESSSSISINTRVGTKKVMYCTGVGKCFLAYMDNTHINMALDTEIKRYTPNTVTSKEEIRKYLCEVRRQGYAFDNEEYELGISCVAAPVFGFGDKVIASISLTGPSTRIKDAGVDNIASALKRAAAEISSRLNL